MQTDKRLKYHDLVEELRDKILSGQIRPGEKLPSENELAAAHAISRQTVRKALQILENEGFVYAEHGRGTFCAERGAHRSSHNIAVVTTYLSDYIFPRVIQGIDQVLTEKGYSILLKNTRNSRAMEAKIIEELLQKDIDGLIIEPSKSQIYCKHLNLYAMLDKCQIPYVFIQALQQAGIAYDPDKVIWYHTEDRKSHPYEQIRRMAKNREKLFFDAVVAYNDEVAISVIQALEAENLSCPKDVSVTGYDNSYLATSCKVPLTTIAHPQEKLGSMAAKLLLSLMEKEEVGQTKIIIEPELVIRDSCQ